MNHNTLTPSNSNYQPGDHDNTDVVLSDKEQAAFSNIVENNPDLASIQSNESESYASFGDYIEKTGDDDWNKTPTVENVSTKLGSAAQTESQKISYLHAGREAKKLAQAAAGEVITPAQSVESNSTPNQTAETPQVEVKRDSDTITPEAPKDIDPIKQAITERLKSMSPEDLARYTAELGKRTGRIAEKAAQAANVESPAINTLRSSGGEYSAPVTARTTRTPDFGGSYARAEKETKDDEQEPTTLLGRIARYFKNAEARQAKRREKRAKKLNAKINYEAAKLKAKADKKVTRAEARADRKTANKKQLQIEREQIRAGAKRVKRVGRLAIAGTLELGSAVKSSAKNTANFLADRENDGYLVKKIQERRNKSENDTNLTAVGTETGPVSHRNTDDNPNEAKVNFAANMRDTFSEEYTVDSPRASRRAETSGQVSVADLKAKLASDDTPSAEKLQA